MRVIMDVFSGRPNPSWRLTPQDARELIHRVAKEPVRLPVERPAQLGFRGLVVEADVDDQVWRAGLPYRFTVGETAAAAQRRATPPAVNTAALASPRASRDLAADIDLTRWLLGTGKDKVSDDLLGAVDEMLSGRPRTESAASASGAAARPAKAAARPAKAAAQPAEETAQPAEAAPPPAPLPAGCQPFLTPLRLDFWNSVPIQPYNNCYNYASNCVSNTLAQPGRYAGNVYTSFDCEALIAAAAADGCLPACEGRLRVLALAIWPGFDFHWWRLHPNDIWAQKLGRWIATYRDNSGRIIGGGLTPETSDRTPYTTFCGYFYAPLAMFVM